jgi:hypothetical protein
MAGVVGSGLHVPCHGQSQWDGGNIVFPYPMQLAKCLIDDQLCILDSSLDEEEA